MKIGYSKTYPIIGKEQWEKNWLEDDINLNLDLVNCTDEEIAKAMLNVRKIQYALKKQVESFHYESNKAAEKENVKEKEPQKSEEELIIEAIESMNDLKFLRIYEKHRDKSPAVRQAFDKKFSELDKK